ncbi:MAG: ABC transporter ATP-binding protein [Deltaproteobacteria bacterium]|nr:ABC transporter ATP-binding protein [Deltaproteobacteria bacterium]
MKRHQYTIWFKSNLKNLAHQVYTLPRAISLVKDAAGRWGLAWAGLLVISGLLPAAVALLSKFVIDGISAAAGQTGPADLMAVILPASLLACAIILSMLCQTASDWVRTLMAERISDHVTGLIHDKSTSIDMAYYDFAEFYDHLHRAKSEAAHRPLALMENLGDFFKSAITFISMIGLIIPYGYWLAALLTASTIPAFFVAIHHRLKFHEWWKSVTQKERKAGYLDWLVTSRESAAEIRAFDTGDHFKAAYQALRKGLRRERMGLVKSEKLSEITGASMALAITCAVMIRMVLEAVAGRVTPGDLVLFYQAFTNGQKMARALLSNIGEIYGNSLFIEDLFTFLSLVPAIKDPVGPGPVIAGEMVEIQFENVYFHYPGASRDALCDFCLCIPAGKTVAIVGKNGAGKSTIVRLLCRFYDPDRGKITINGVDIRQIPIARLRRMLTVMFQAPVQYADTISGNIAASDIDAGRPERKIRAAAEAAGADKIAGRMAGGYDTLLGRWLSGGTDLSGGEWRRLALARTAFRDGQIIVLDEPTSSMDSWAEAEWTARFAEYACGRTAIIVTHRFTTAMHADIICVMDNGRVLESGAHETLVAKNGLYAESWQAQMGVRSLI